MFDLHKRTRGTALGWFWLLMKPAMYVFCLWFALEIGLRAGRSVPGDYPFFLWLCSGLIPWFFMQDMLNAGSDSFKGYPYLIKKFKFPLGAIPFIRSTADLLIQVILQIILICIYFGVGMQLDVHLVQVPIILIIMYLFWSAFSLATSQISGMSRDFAQLVRTFSTPLFWLSGVIYDLSRVPVEWFQTIMLFNPITFFATSFRMAICDHQWIWENPTMLGSFGVVFLLTVVAMAVIYKFLHREVVDVL